MSSTEHFDLNSGTPIDEYDQLLAERKALRSAQLRYARETEADTDTAEPEVPRTSEVDMYGYLNQLRLSDPSQAPSRSRRIGRLGGKSVLWSGRR